MKSYRLYTGALLETVLLMPMLVFGQSMNQTPDPVTSATSKEAIPSASSDNTCVPSKSGLVTTSLENNASAMKGATDFATQLLGAYKDDPTKEPDLSSQYGLLDISILSAVLCNESAKAVTTTLVAEGTTAQTNKQNGAPPSSNGSTSAVQKIGIQQLLGIAVENGAITNNVNGNTMTLSTSIYGFAAGFLRDTQSAYAKCPLCVLFGASATFNLTNTSDPLQNASRKQVSQWQVKYTFKDTSIRSKRVVPIYEADEGLASAATKLAIDLSNSANASGAMIRLNKDLESVLKDPTKWKAMQDLIKSQAPNTGGTTTSGAAATGSRPGGASAGADTAASQIATQLLKYLDSDTAYQSDLKTALTDPGLRDVTARYVADLKAYVSADKVFEAKVKNLQQGFNGDVTFGEQFPTTAATSGTGSTASMPVYLVEGVDLTWQPHTSVPKDGSTAPLKLSPWPSTTANFASSFYTNPVAALNEKTFRGGTAALQAQWSLGQGPFIKNSANKSQVTISLSGNYQRLQENEHVAGKKADIALGNVKLEIPISSGISFPISVTFANSSEQIKESYVRGNFGVSFDLDKLASLLNAK